MENAEWYEIALMIATTCLTFGILMMVPFVKGVRKIIRITLMSWLGMMTIIMLRVITSNMDTNEKWICILMLIAGFIVIPFITILFMKRTFEKRGLKIDFSEDINT